MTVRVTNSQREAPVDAGRMARLARGAARRLKIRTPGTLSITFITARKMRALNKRFLRHDWDTDVLSFRYDGEPVVGEILIAPRLARTYAREHDLAYDAELSRYVVHGLLHWLGHDDATLAQQRRMRAAENKLLQISKIKHQK
jgi:probable rRNA maturation factor